MWVLRESNAEGFYYVPVTPSALGNSDLLQTLHRAAAVFFYPIWYIDHAVFGFPYWASAPLMTIDEHSSRNGP
jgi:hypothetical protein